MRGHFENNVKDFALGTDHSLVLKTDGTLWAAGDNKCGQLGVELDLGFWGQRQPGKDHSASFSQVTGQWKAACAGMFFSMGLSESNDVYLWGSIHHNTFSSTKCTDGPHSLTPMPIKWYFAMVGGRENAGVEFENVVAESIACGFYHGAVLVTG